MLQPVRRIVTGHTADGRSVVISDGVADAVAENKDWPGRGITFLWKSDTAPADNQAPASSPLSILPNSVGSTFIISQIPPEAEIGAMDGTRQARLADPTARAGKGLIQRDTRRHPGMHATDTLDYIVLLAGEMTMLLDEGEVVLRPFDVLIQRGTNHAWINRGSQTAVMATVVIAAEPLGDAEG